MKKIAIFGFGKEGVSAANYFGDKYQIEIIEEKSQRQIDKTLFKKLTAKNVNFNFNGNLPSPKNIDFLIRSPSFRPDHHKIEFFTQKGIKLTSSTNIFFEKCPADIIGVTGTKGKGTTSTIIFEILKRSKKDVYLAGNIGNPMLEILPIVKKRFNCNFRIIELSIN